MIVNIKKIFKYDKVKANQYFILMISKKYKKWWKG